MRETGVIHGRFQILHNDHLAYLMAGKDRCRHLVVGITNPDPVHTGKDPTDPGRSDPGANPLSYYERHRLVTAVMLEAGLHRQDFLVVPFPVNFPELYRYYVPLDATFFLTIYDGWGKKKLELFRKLGLQTDVLWERPLSQKGLTGGEIRKLMVRGESWEHLLPPASSALMIAWGIPERLRGLVDRRNTII